MARGPGKLCGMIEPNSDHVWNSSGMIEDSASSFESQIGDWRTALIYKKYRHERMARIEEDDDVWSLEDDEWKFTIGHLTSSNSIIKFDADGAPEESDLIRFFWEGLKLWLKWNYASGN